MSQVFTLLALALAFASMATARATYPSLVAGAIAVATNWRGVRDYLRGLTRIRWAWFYLAFMLVATCLFTAFPEFTYIQAARAGSGLLLALAMMQLPIKKHPNLSIGAVAMFALILTLAAPVIESYSVLPFSLPGPLARISELTGDTINPNVFAGVLAVLVCIPISATITLLFAQRPHRSRSELLLGLVFLVLSGFLFVVIWRAQSRGALISAILGCFVIVLLRWPRVGFALIVAGLAVALIYIWRQGLDSAQNSVVSLGGLSSKEGPESRLELLELSGYMLQDFAFTGIGMGGFASVTELLYPIFTIQPHAHNLFLQIAIDLGIPGLLAWLVILFSVCRSCVRVIRDPVTKNSPAGALAAGLLASQVAMCTHGMVDAVVWGQVRTAPLVWILWGVALGLERASLGNRTPKPLPIQSNQAQPAAT